MPSLTRVIPSESDQARKILREIQSRVRASQRKLGQKYKDWEEAENKALAYLPATVVDKKREAERDQGKPQYTTIVIPYSYAVVMAAHTYITSVFLGRNPVFQYTGRHGESQQQVQAMEALVDYQLLVGRMLPPLYIWLHDVLKYGVAINTVYWGEEVSQVSQIKKEEIVDPLLGQPTGEFKKVQKTIRQTTYAGNVIRNIQPWDFLWDVRVPAHDFQRGEYVAVKIDLSWNDAKRREYQGYYFDLDKIGRGIAGTVDSNRATSELERPDNNSVDWTSDVSGFDISHPERVKGYECHIELIPKEWGLSSSDFPEKWVFTCTADFKVLIGAQPLGALHCKYPFNVLALEPEGYGILTRGIYDTLKPVQETVDWLVNSHFYNVRSALNNTLIVDPSRVVMKDLLNPAPGKLIRLKPAAYGSDARMAVNQLQINDVTQNNFRDFSAMLGIGERIVGVNDQIMGMVNAGGSSRKTATEVRTSSSFGVNRLKTMCEWFSAQGWDPLSMQLVQNTQQYYDDEKKFKIAGDLMAGAGAQFMMVTPDSISGFYSYVPVDGTQPIDRYAQSMLWTQLFGQIRQFPQLMMNYDIGRIFEWVAQTAGLKNITQFRVQVGSPQQLQQAALAGNVIPMPGSGKQISPSATSPGSNSQVPGMGVPG